MTEFIDIASHWYALPLGALIFLLTFGFAPGMALRLLVMIYPKGDPRRQELIAELYVLGRVERLLFVGEQLETALTEGLALRYSHWRDFREEVRKLDRKRIWVQRHWASLAWETFAASSLVATGILVSPMLPPDGWINQDVLWYAVLAVVLRYSYVVTVRTRERIVITDQRILITTGVFNTKMLMMPFTKVTDITYKRSRAGRMFGYGTMIMESAGKVQALNRIDYLPRPELLYDAISELAFSNNK